MTPEELCQKYIRENLPVNFDVMLTPESLTMMTQSALSDLPKAECFECDASNTLSAQNCVERVLTYLKNNQSFIERYLSSEQDTFLQKMKP